MTGLLVALIRLVSGANVVWINARPELRQRVYFANHTSHLDAAVVWASLPEGVRAQTRPVAAKDYWVQGVIRPYLATHVFRAVLIDREKVTAHDNPIDHLLAALGEGCSLILFPEGTRNLDGEIGVFKSGLYHLAKRCPDLEFVPVYIENLNRILPKGEFLPVPLLSNVRFGAPIRWCDGESKPAFLDRARSAIFSLSHP